MEPETPRHTGHETSDAELRPVAWLAVLLAVGVVAIATCLWWLMSHWLIEAERSQPVVSPLALEQPEPPAPRLEASSTAGLTAYRAEQDQKLSSYGWVDKPNFVRIPIERAMELALERGLPTPTQAEPGGKVTPQDQDDKRTDEAETQLPSQSKE